VLRSAAELAQSLSVDLRAGVRMLRGTRARFELDQDLSGDVGRSAVPPLPGA
jgi:hypothetical protein